MLGDHVLTVYRQFP